jgi:hypothetical protein
MLYWFIRARVIIVKLFFFEKSNSLSPMKAQWVSPREMARLTSKHGVNANFLIKLVNWVNTRGSILDFCYIQLCGNQTLHACGSVQMETDLIHLTVWGVFALRYCAGSLFSLHLILKRYEHIYSHVEALLIVWRRVICLKNWERLRSALQGSTL